jgi:hypothetical protein
MKKILFSMVAIATFGITQAQEIKFGAKVGLNASTLTGDIEDAKMLIGAHLGGFVEIKLTDKFSFQPELLYSMQGAKTEYTETFSSFGETEKETYEEKIRLGYLNLPLMFKFYATDKFSIEAGPQIGFLMSAKYDIDYTYVLIDDSDGSIIDSYSDGVKGEDYKDYVKSIDFGFNFGLGYEFTENVGANVRYNLGLSDINDISGSDQKIGNGVFQLSIGYKF